MGKRRDIHNEEIFSEPMDPWRFTNVTLELPLRIDVEDEAAMRR